MSNLEVFNNYVKSGYNLNDPSISLKLDHSIRVADAALKLGKHEGLNEKLCYDIGLLHDFARFEQWKRFASFKDFLTIDHGDLGVELLFEQNYIELFDVDKKDYEVIKFSVKNHNKKEINFAEIDKFYEDNDYYLSKEEFITYCNISRDSDKIDLFYRIGEGNLKMGYTLSGYTEDCLREVLNHTQVDVTKTATILDRLFVFIGFLYDINFKYTFELVDLDKYFYAITNIYGASLNEEDKKTLNFVIEDFKKYYKNMGGK